jgi:hypothetical protein
MKQLAQVQSHSIALVQKGGMGWGGGVELEGGDLAHLGSSSVSGQFYTSSFLFRGLLLHSPLPSPILLH